MNPRNALILMISFLPGQSGLHALADRRSSPGRRQPDIEARVREVVSDGLQRGGRSTGRPSSRGRRLQRGAGTFQQPGQLLAA